MAEVTMRIEVHVAPETLAALRELAATCAGFLARARLDAPDEPEHVMRPVVTKLKPVSGAGERLDDAAEGDHPLCSAPSLDVSSVNLPGAEMLLASFLPEAGGVRGRKVSVWNAARDEVLVRRRAGGEKWGAIRDCLNELPGEMVASAGAVEQRWAKLKKAGLDVCMPSAPGADPRPQGGITAAQPHPEITPAGEARMSVAEARQWAAGRGICNGLGALLDMRAVNEKRAVLGLPKIVLKGLK